MIRIFIFAILTLGFASSGFAQSSNLAPVPSHTVAFYYVIPNDIAYEADVHKRLKESVADIQAWYQMASGGLTFAFESPDSVEVVYGNEGRQYYDAGNWWGPLLEELGPRGYPIWTPGKIVVMFARGSGFWAGGAQGCGGDCGTSILGISLFPEFSNPLYTDGAVCPNGSGASAWPCTPLGAAAHELGHALGLSHPYDNPLTQAYAFHSLMQTHSNYPNFAPQDERPWGFLTNERDILKANPFMYEGIDLYQMHTDADIVNLPISGPAPIANFHYAMQGNSINLTNTSTGGNLYYWTFGDGKVSNEISPIHTYDSPGIYTLSLRVSNNQSMMDMKQMSILVSESAQINGFMLVDADLNEDIRPIYDGEIIHKETLAANRLNIRAMTSTTGIGSVQFAWDGNVNFRTENVAPYALGGDRNGNYFNFPLHIGVHSLAATPFSGPNASGNQGPEFSISFEIIESDIAVEGFSLYNADTDQLIGPVQDGDLIHTNTLGTLNLNIVAHTNPETVGSVRFGLNQNTSFRLENKKPYAMAGDNSRGNFYAYQFSSGSYTLTATPYKLRSGRGAEGVSKSITFQVMANSQRSNSYTSNLKISPNPSSNYLVLEVEQAQKGLANLALLDVLGKTILSEEFIIPDSKWTKKIDVRALVPGMYILKFSQNDGSIMRQVIKQ